MTADINRRKYYWWDCAKQYTVAEMKELGLWDNLSEKRKRFFIEAEKRANSPEYKKALDEFRKEHPEFFPQKEAGELAA